MSEPHPKLCFRPKAQPGLKRPTRKHPVLGTLEYINQDGGWWQGSALIAGSFVRVDVQQDANVSDDALKTAALFLQLLQKNEAKVRAYVAKQLTDGEARSNMATSTPELRDPAILKDLQPYEVVLWSKKSELHYQCDCLPGGNLFGAQQISVDIEAGKSPGMVTLLDLGLHRRFERFFDRPVPKDALDFENSLGDQLIAKAASGTLELDAELRDHLAQAIENADRRIKNGSPECASYMTSAKLLLQEIAKGTQSALVSICVDLSCQHPSGKLDPFKKKLVLAPDDCVTSERSGSTARVRMLWDQRTRPSKGDPELHVQSLPGNLRPEDFDDNEGFVQELQAQLENAARWLSRQSPTAFQELREAGFVMTMDINIFAQLGQDPIAWELPPAFLFECGRHGLRVSVITNNSGAD